MAKWNVTSRYSDTESELLLDPEGNDYLEIEADTEEQALDIAYENGYIPRHKAVTATV